MEVGAKLSWLPCWNKSQELEVHATQSFCFLGETPPGRQECWEPQGLYVFAERGISVLVGIRASFREDPWPKSPERQRCLAIGLEVNSLQSKTLEYTRAQRISKVDCGFCNLRNKVSFNNKG